MKSDIVKRPGSIVHVHVELTPEEFKHYWQTAFDEAVSRVQLKGFRPGTAPRELASQAVDQKGVFEEAANEAVRETLRDLGEENKWTIIDKPKVIIDSKDNNFTFDADLVLFPEVILGDYKGIAHHIFSEVSERIKNISVTPEEVEKSYNWLQKSEADLKNFKDDASLKKSINDGLLIEKQQHETERGRIKAIEEIFKHSKIEIPHIMIEKIQSQGLDEEAARANVASHLVIYKIAQIENLAPTEKEVQERLKDMTDRGESIDNGKIYDYIYGTIQNQKVIEFLEKA